MPTKIPPIRLVPGTRDVIFLQEFMIETSQGKLTIPKNFRCDSASVPRIFWPIISPFDPGVREPAFAHDVLYRLPNARYIDGERITRKMADRVFYEELLESNLVPNWKARLMWMAVRLGGASSWRDK